MNEEYMKKHKEEIEKFFEEAINIICETLGETLE